MLVYSCLILSRVGVANRWCGNANFSEGPGFQTMRTVSHSTNEVLVGVCVGGGRHLHLYSAFICRTNTAKPCVFRFSCLLVLFTSSCSNLISTATDRSVCSVSTQKRMDSWNLGLSNSFKGLQELSIIF